MIVDVLRIIAIFVVVAVIQKSTLRKCAEQQSASCEFLSQIGQAKDARDDEFIE
jgi:hypothetical protein